MAHVKSLKAFGFKSGSAYPMVPKTFYIIAPLSVPNKSFKFLGLAGIDILDRPAIGTTYVGRNSVQRKTDRSDAFWNITRIDLPALVTWCKSNYSELRSSWSKTLAEKGASQKSLVPEKKFHVIFYFLRRLIQLFFSSF